MAICYAFKPNLALAVVVWDGKITLDLWMQHLRRFLPEPAQSSIKKQIVELRYASIVDPLGKPEFEKALAVIEERNVFAGRQVAAVTDENYDRARAFEQMSGRLRATMIVFNDLDPACVWLGVERKLVDEQIRALRQAEAAARDSERRR